MQQFPKWKIFLTVLVCILAIIFALPNFIGKRNLPFLPSQKINYGLDLRGGSHILLKVDFQTYLNDQLSVLVDMVRKELRKNKIAYLKLRNHKSYVSFDLKNPENFDRVQKLLLSINRNITVDHKDSAVTISFSAEQLEKMEDDLIEQSREIIRMRVDEAGTLDPSIQRQGKSNILLQVPGLQDPEEIKRVLGKTAKMTFHIVSDVIPYGSKPSSPPLGTRIMQAAGNDKNLYVVNSKVLVSGDLLTNAAAMVQSGAHVVSFEFNRLGARLFADVTKNNPGKLLAIVIDNKVISAPRINEPILGGSGVIQGSFTAHSASELALLLRAGALPAPLQIIEERTVGPTLGQDSIELGKTASIIAIVSVAVFMLLLYGVYGLFASVALIFNLVLLIAVITILHATLTLPGIAGIVLTMGMAVDANVLIFERIKEEVMLKSSLQYSIKRGFSQAFATILDSNITTLLAAFFLYAFGTGVVKSFSVTLTIGILSSMFTAITLTKLMITVFVRNKK